MMVREQFFEQSSKTLVFCKLKSIAICMKEETIVIVTYLLNNQLIYTSFVFPFTDCETRLFIIIFTKTPTDAFLFFKFIIDNVVFKLIQKPTNMITT